MVDQRGISRNKLSSFMSYANENNVYKEEVLKGNVSYLN